MEKIKEFFTALFGKYLPGHYDENGNFIPGDIYNRLNCVNKWIVKYNVQGKYNPIVLKRLVSIPSGWQGAVQNYFRSLSGGISLTTVLLIFGAFLLIKK